MSVVTDKYAKKYAKKNDAYKYRFNVVDDSFLQYRADQMKLKGMILI